MDDLNLPEKINRDVSTTSIPPLDGTNYGIWKKAMRILFMRLNLLPIIDSEVPLDANALWDKCDRWVFSEIYFNCGKKEQQSLSDTMSAREAWDTLADVYQSSSLSNIFRLTTEFHSLKQIPGQPAIEFINTVLAAATDLRFLGDNLHDLKIKWQLLGNLLPEYAGLVTALTNLDTDDNPMTMEELKARILTEERMLIHRNVLPNHHAPQPHQPPPPPPPPPAVYSAVTNTMTRCSACGVQNHHENECWRKYPDKAPPWWLSRRPHRAPRVRNHDTKRNKQSVASDSDTFSSSSSSEDCNYRKKHRDCKHRKKHKRKHDVKRGVQEKNKQKALTMLETPYIDHSCMMRLQQQRDTGTPRWMLDSGASNHYTANRHSFATFNNLTPVPIETASKIIYGIAIGDVILELTCGTIRISEVIYVPQMVNHTNLISVGQLEGHGLEFTIKNGVWNIWKAGSLWAAAQRENNVYFLQELHQAHMMSSHLRRTDIQDVDIWHRRMGHLNRKYISALKSLADGMDFGTG